MQAGSLRAGQGLILIVIALLTIGVIMVNSAGLSISEGQVTSLEGLLLGRPTILALLAIAMLLLGSRVPVMSLYRARGLQSPVPWIVLGSVVLLGACYLPIIGHPMNGARRWINAGPMTLQPSEIAKWGLLIVIAWHATRRAASMGTLRTGLVAPLAVVGIICAAIAIEDLGTAVLIGLVCTLMLLAGGARVRHAALAVPIAVGGFALAVITNPYRLNRLKAFLDPFEDPQGIGYHVIQSMGAVTGGGIPGRGLGNSVQKFGYLPEDTTDFIFSIICEELGLAGAIVVIALYTVLLLCGLAIVRRTRHPFERLLGLGIVLTIGLQALINLTVVTGMAPTKGIALPLISAGGTGWLLTAFALGLLVSMDRTATAADELSVTDGREDDDVRSDSIGLAPSASPITV